MTKTLNINFFYSNMDSNAKEKYETIKDVINKVLNDGKDLYLGVTVEESEEK